MPVWEVTDPDTTQRRGRGRGKDDTLDAIAAARAALTGQRVSLAKDRSGAVEALRPLRTTRKTAARCRRAAPQRHDEVAELDRPIEPLVAELAPRLLRLKASSGKTQRRPPA